MPNSKGTKDHIIDFIIGSFMGYFVFFLIAVIKDFASCGQIIIPSFVVGLIYSIWKDKFLNWFLELAKWF
jgi:hypothetical protein